MQALIICSFLVVLGNWQLKRATEKEQLLLQFSHAETALNNTPIHLFDKVELNGRLLTDRFFLVDNRTWQGRVGYELIAAIQTNTAPSIQLVSMGWLAAGTNRNSLPQISLPSQQIRFTAYADKPSQPLMLGKDPWSDTWPKRIQRVDLKKISLSLNLPVSQWLYHPTTPIMKELILTWKPVVLPPQRHIGYAVQWFGLAAAWFICSGVLARKMLTNKEITA